MMGQLSFVSFALESPIPDPPASRERWKKDEMANRIDEIAARLPPEYLANYTAHGTRGGAEAARKLKARYRDEELVRRLGAQAVAERAAARELAREEAAARAELESVGHTLTPREPPNVRARKGRGGAMPPLPRRVSLEEQPGEAAPLGPRAAQPSPDEVLNNRPAKPPARKVS